MSFGRQNNNNQEKVGAEGNGAERSEHGLYKILNFGLQLECTELQAEQVPDVWPAHLERVLIRNSTLSIVQKNAFRRQAALEELRIENCARLDALDRHAFKGLPKLK